MTRTIPSSFMNLLLVLGGAGLGMGFTAVMLGLVVPAGPRYVTHQSSGGYTMTVDDLNGDITLDVQRNTFCQGWVPPAPGDCDRVQLLGGGSVCRR